MLHSAIRRADPLRRLVGLAVTSFALALTGCITIDLPGGVPDPLQESVIYGKGRGPKILLLDIQGVIRETPGSTSFLGTRPESMLSRLREELDLARRDDSIRALLLRINSPGGTATASDILYEEILRFKREAGIPVIAQLMGMATSGGYYVAASADEIVAHPTTVTGSIGVIFSGLNFSGLMKKIGVENQTITSGPYKDAGSMIRPMSADERAQLQSVLDDMFVRFKSVVTTSRTNLSADQVDALADGRIYSAPQALAAGLVDRIGSLEDSVGVVEQRAGIEDARVVTYHRPREYRNNLYTRGPTPPPQLKIELLPDWPDIPRPAFLYLWAPGLD